MESPSTRASLRRLLAAALFPALGLLGVALGLSAGEGLPLWLVAPVVAVVLVPGVVGVLVVRRHPRHVVGWLLLVHSLLVGFALTSPPPQSSGAVERAVAQASQGTWVFLYVCLVLIGYLFPDGRFLSPRWRTWVAVCLVGYVAFLVGAAFDVEGYHALFPGEELPVAGPPEPVTAVLGLGGLVMVAASLVGTVVCARRRLALATGDERLQMLWFTWSAASIPMMLAVCWGDIAFTGAAGPITVLGISCWAASSRWASGWRSFATASSTSSWRSAAP